MADARFGTFVLAGRPNAGKSTLLNALVGTHLAIVSAKPQSTRTPTVGVVTAGDTQLALVDPPGLLDPQYALQQAMVEAALEQLRTADGVVYLHPADEGDVPALEALLSQSVEIAAPVLSVITKADLLSKAVAESNQDRPGPPATALDRLAVSAATGEGLDSLLAWCRSHAKPGAFRYDPDDISTQPVRFFAAEYVREAAFELLDQELPYAVAVEIDEFRESENPVYIRATLLVERESQKGMVIGKGGRTIKGLGALARPRIEALLGERVFLDLWVKVLPKWRRSPEALQRLGFQLPARRKS